MGLFTTVRYSPFAVKPSPTGTAAPLNSAPISKSRMPVRQLPEGIVNRIAAGEVVERPASVVKELVENALDAGARRLECDRWRRTAAHSRRRRRRGHESGDPRSRSSAMRRPSSTDDDLLSIRTLGFRGEALPSIGAVARLAIVTRHADEPHAWTITVDGGHKGEVKPAALGEGTRVEVRDLFYATPARLNSSRATAPRARPSARWCAASP